MFSLKALKKFAFDKPNVAHMMISFIGKKTFWQKERMNFWFFCTMVSKAFTLRLLNTSGFCSKELLFTTQSPTFNDLETRSLLKTLWKKEKMLVTSIFSFPHNVFYLSQSKFQFLSHNYFVVCKKLSIQTSLNFCCLVKS